MSEVLINALCARARDPATRTDQAAVLASAARRPVNPITLERAEAALGRSLPTLLRAAYLKVGDGGFGPGYGLLPLFADGNTSGDESVVDIYRAFSSTDPEDPAWIWPAHLVPFCDWGCAIRSCV